MLCTKCVNNFIVVIINYSWSIELCQRRWLWHSIIEMIKLEANDMYGVSRRHAVNNIPSRIYHFIIIVGGSSRVSWKPICDIVGELSVWHEMRCVTLTGTRSTCFAPTTRLSYDNLLRDTLILVSESKSATI